MSLIRTQNQLSHGPNRQMTVAPEPEIVAQTSESAVSPVSKPARRTTSDALPIWKSAIQQVWKPALRRGIGNL